MDRVTITGADTKTPISALIDLSAEFPFVEWGILVSQKQQGGPRFPDAAWCERFADAAAHIPTVRCSMHVCGEWVRRILRGDMLWSEFPVVRGIAQRIQLNTHAEEHVSTVGVFDWMAFHGKIQTIVQLDGVNDHILDAAVAIGLNVAGLFDCSHGAGLVPAKWPEVPSRNGSIYHGYAGGIGPDNVYTELRRIEKSRFGTIGDYWIDMEDRVRDDNGEFDLAKVRAVLEACAPIADRQTTPAQGGAE